MPRGAKSRVAVVFPQRKKKIKNHIYFRISYPERSLLVHALRELSDIAGIKWPFALILQTGLPGPEPGHYTRVSTLVGGRLIAILPGFECVEIC